MVIDALVSKASDSEKTTDYNVLLIGFTPASTNRQNSLYYNGNNTSNIESKLKMELYCDKKKAILFAHEFSSILYSSGDKFIVLDRYLYVIGNTNVKIDLKDLKNTSLPSMNTKRTEFSIGSLNGCIYVIGGSSSNAYLKSVEWYNYNTVVKI